MNKFRSIDTVTLILGVIVPVILVTRVLNWWIEDTMRFKEEVQASTHGYSTFDVFNVDYDIYFYENNGVLECRVANNSGNTIDCTIVVESNGIQIVNATALKVGDYLQTLDYSGDIGDNNHLIYIISNKGNTSKIKCPIIIERR